MREKIAFMRRIILISIFLFFALVLMPKVVNANQSWDISATSSDNVTATLYDDGKLVISGTGKMKDCSAGSVSWFSQKDQIKTVEIKSGVTNIGDRAFYQCTSLTKIVIPDSVTSIGISSFYQCKKMENIKIPKNVINIKESAFKACEGLTSIEIPSNVTSIGNNAFEKCSSLTSITIPEGVTSIEHDAFSNCTNLTSITIPSNVTSIGNNAFEKCSSLTSITIPEGVTSIEKYTFNRCSNLTRITIPSSVTSIGNKAFEYCSNLTEIIIPNNSNLTSIGYYAFNECSSLESITIPRSVTSIEYHAFEKCSSLKSIEIPENSSLTRIGEYVFHCCSNLTSITIPSSVTSIGDNAFQECSSLKSIEIPENSSLTRIGKFVFCYCSKLTSITIPRSVTSIEQDAFEYCSSLTSITIPNSVTSIGGGAFQYCSSLESIKIPNSVTSIGSYAFYECSSLQSITIPEGVTSIEEYAFYKCSNLISIKIPSSVTSIGKNAFQECKKLKSIEIRENSSLESIGFQAFEDCESLEEINMPDSLTSIGNSAFGWCTNLKNLTIAKNSSLTSIGDSAFWFCWSLKRIEIPNSVTSIGSSAFYECSSLESIEIPSSVTSIGDAAFFRCSKLKIIENLSSVTSIGTNAFSGCNDNLKIQCIKGSIADKYAKANKIKTEYVYFWLIVNPNEGKYTAMDGSTQMVSWKKPFKTGTPIYFARKGSYDTNYECSSEPEREGYQFSNWRVTNGKVSLEKGEWYIFNADYTGDVTVTAEWTPNTYTIKYNGNGSTLGSMTESTHTYNVEKALTANAYKREYTVTYDYNGSGASNTRATATYTFGSWNTKEDGKGTSYPDQKSVKNLTTTNKGTVDLYAQWTGGNVKLPIPTRTGYTFGGWYKEAKCENKVEDGGKNYAPTANITLYAKWTENTVTLKFYGNGGTAKTSATSTWQNNNEYCTQTIPYTYSGNSGTAEDFNMYNVTSLYTKTGYHEPDDAQAWRKGSASSTDYVNQAHFNAKALMEKESVTLNLYANWTPNTLKLYFYPNGGEIGGTDPNSVTSIQSGEYAGASSMVQTIKYTDSDVENKNVWNVLSMFTRTGYHVDEKDAWKDGSASTTQTLTQGVYNFKNILSNEGNQVKKLYANWKPNSYKVHYNGHGETSGSMAESTHTYNVEKALNANAYKKEYTVTYNNNGSGESNTTAKATYSFDSWNTDPNGKGTKYLDKALVKNLTSVNNETVTIYAQWTGGNVKLKTPTRTGYTFEGWYSDSACTKKVGNGGVNYTPTANVTLYAKWIANKYYVKYNGNGATAGNMENSEHRYNDAKELTANAYKREYTVTYNYNGSGANNTTAKSTYTFGSWNTKADGEGTSYPDKKSVTNLTATNNGTVNLYAQWTGGNVKLKTPTRTGYTFGGWYKEAKCENKVKDGGENYAPTANITLYAKWTPNTLKLYFYPNGGKQGGTDSNSGTAIESGEYAGASTMVQTIKYTDTDIENKNIWNVLSMFTRAGYHIDEEDAWKDGSASTTQTLTQGTFNFKNILSNEGNQVKKLYANWKPDTYTVKYDLTGGTGTIANQTKIQDQTLILRTEIPTKTGYTFNGWFLPASGDLSPRLFKAGGEFKENRNVTLEALWEGNVYEITLNSDNATTKGTEKIYEAYSDGWYLDEDLDKKMTTSKNPIIVPKREYKVNFEYNGATGNKEEASRIASCKFLGYMTTDENKCYISETGKISNEANSRKFLDKGELKASWEKASIQLPIPTKEGYTFEGWYRDEELTNLAGKTSYEISLEDTQKERTFYAKWTKNEENKCTITYISEIEQEGMEPTQTVSKNDTITLPTLSKNKYIFKGWTTEKESTEVEYEGGAEYTVTEDKVFYAVWEEDKITGIEMVQNPDKTEYIVGESLDLTGGKLRVNYEKSEPEEIEIKEEMVESLNLGEAEENKEIVVTYKEKYTTKFTVRVVDVSVSKIEIKALPDKTSYYVGEELNPEGLKVEATYNTGKTEDVTNKVTTSEFDNSTAGKKTITVSYGGKEESFEVEVKENEITAIELISEPTKNEYFIGEELNLEGLQVNGVYSNGEEKDITDKVAISELDSSTAGEKTITVSYGGKTATFAIEVKEKELAEIEIKSWPTKEKYFKEESLDKEGLKVNAIYNNGETEDVTDKITTTGFDSSTAGTKTIVVSYGGKEVSFEVEVEDIELTRIEIVKEPTKKVYFIGEEINSEGLQVNAIYNNGKTEDVTDKVEPEGFDSSTTGKIMVTIRYGEKTADYEVEIKEKELTEIEITKEATKKVYFIGDEINTGGIKVEAKYNNGETEDVTNKITTKGFDSSTIGEKEIEVRYEGKTAKYVIEVKGVRVTKLTIKNPVNKTSYFVGEELDKEGLKVNAIYNNGTTEDVTNKVTTTGFDSSTAGTKTIVVSYGGKEVSFEVEVKEAEVSEIEIIIKENQQAIKNVVQIDYKKYLIVDKNTKAKEILNDLETNSEDAELEIKGATSSEDKAKTGQEITIANSDEETNLVIIVKGDVDSDGEVSFIDILKLNNYRLDKELNEQNWKETEKIAFKAVRESEITDSEINGLTFIDIVALNNYRLNNN